MSHAYDVINCHFKREIQKQQKMEISKIHDRLRISIVEKAFWSYNRFCYFPLFHRKLSEGQEIDHMIKWAKNGNLHILKLKIFVFLLWILLIQLRILLFLPFFVFESDDMVIESGKNLPIDSEFMILSFEWLYDLLYIIWKRAICRFQKYAFPQNLMIVVEITIIFRSRLWKWPFSIKSTESAHVMHD